MQICQAQFGKRTSRQFETKHQVEEEEYIKTAGNKFIFSSQLESNNFSSNSPKMERERKKDKNGKKKCSMKIT